MKHKKRPHPHNSANTNMDPSTVDPNTNIFPEAIYTREVQEPDQSNLTGMTTGATSTAASATSAATSNEHAELEEQLRSAHNKAAEAESIYMRMAADFENYRKRVDRERKEFLAFGLQQAAEAMLPALDDLDRAQSTLNAQMRPEDLLNSIKLVGNRIHQSVEQIGLKPIEALGEHFDPQFHEPVQKVETSEFPDGAVMEVLRKGYMLNGKVIRPALVNVASGKPSDHQDEPAESIT